VRLGGAGAAGDGEHGRLQILEFRFQIGGRKQFTKWAYLGRFRVLLF